MSRTDQAVVSLAVDGVDYGIWDKLTGGDMDSNETKYKPGGGVTEVSLGGTRMVTDVVLTRLYVLERDHVSAHALLNRVGRGTGVATKQPTDVDGNIFGRPLVYAGRLKTVNFPDADSMGNAAALIVVTISSAGEIG